MTTIDIKLTKLQREEISHRVWVRRDSVEEDSSAADEFEAVPGNLDNLEDKLQASKGPITLTEGEAKWVKSEVENIASAFEANFANEGFKVQASVNSLYNVADKLS